MKLSGLSRQIASSMMKIAVGSALIAILVSFVFYYLWDKYLPNHMPNDDYLTPSWPEWIWIILTFIIVILLAVNLAIKLSQRILAPLSAVSEGMRKIAEGDLHFRANVADHSLGEAALLVDDFNLLADKLQRMTEEHAFWNAAIAHELRTPVTILRGRLQGLAEGVFTPDRTQFTKLLVQIEGLSRLIEDLRVISLMNSDELRISKKETDLATEIKLLTDLSVNMLNEADQYVELNVTTHPVFCDPTRIRQALLAILENASKYALPGVITISTQIKDGFCYLSVEDSGPGISPELIPHIFTAFRSAKDNPKSGSGLGLAVVSAIATAHNGNTRCYISEKGGTVIELCWPF
ncbi:HAMP domain-containing histidine kinase [Vibrio cincinnatiensis]|uniref:ATP-binding protein n=1 Tax=Vibrio cincinnatiensis TaxID=675 RepID=UPI001EDDB57E|nr:ATP-binding protein [Vibrio cincinnatiensis]MCG3735404.1 HAMP domain-containing histidine kinase [Vibrio cincinnatiensis]MCG3766033.1 HAMP domain-containing histidine kinase [Vibrio cincinnatiensis]